MLNPFAVRGGSPLERVIRSLALVGVLLVVIWAFWVNNQRMAVRLNQDKAFWDQTDTLDEADKEFVREFLAALAEEYSRQGFVQVRTGGITPPPGLDAQDFFLGLSPGRREVAVQLPGDMDGESDRAFAAYLAGEHFQADWEDWPRALKTALVMTWERFSAAGPVGPTLAAGPSPFVSDATGKLDADERRALDRYGHDLAATYGLELRVRVFTGPVVQPPLGPVTLFLGLSPNQGQAVLRFPAMLERAVGPELQPDLLQGVLAPSLAQGTWPEGIMEVLGRVWLELSGEERSW